MSTFILGCGGQAAVVLSILRANGQLLDELQLVDQRNNAKPNEKKFDLRIKNINDVPINKFSKSTNFLAIGDVKCRFEIATHLSQNGITFSSLIHPLSRIDTSAIVGKGTIVCSGAYIGPNVKVGENCIINTSAIIEHDADIGNGSNVSPGCIVCGKSRIGAQVHLGAGSTIIENTNIEDSCFVAAGAVVVKDILTSHSKVKGIPATYYD